MICILYVWNQNIWWTTKRCSKSDNIDFIQNTKMAIVINVRVIVESPSQHTCLMILDKIVCKIYFKIWQNNNNIISQHKIILVCNSGMHYAFFQGILYSFISCLTSHSIKAHVLTQHREVVRAIFMTADPFLILAKILGSLSNDPLILL